MEKIELEMFSRKLAELMAMRGLSQSDLARAVWGGMTDNRGRDVAKNRDRISFYVRGSRLPEPKTMKMLADALGVPLDDLHPPLAVPVGSRNPSPVTFTIMAGQEHLAMLTVKKIVPVALAAKIVMLLTESDTIE